MRETSLALCLAAVGCAAPAAVPTAPAPLPSVAPVNACGGRDDVVLSTHDVVLTCRVDHRACTGVVKFEVHNCADEPRRIVALHVIHDGAPSLSLSPWDEAFAPGAHGIKRYEHLPAGRYTLQAELDIHGVRRMTDTVPFSVHNPARDQAHAACVACNGVWGSQGRGTEPTCNCATGDAGAYCDDGNDCAGECRFERFDEVRPAIPACPDCDTMLPALGRPVGRCTARRVSFGCRARVPPGASSTAPIQLPAEPPFACDN